MVFVYLYSVAIVAVESLPSPNPEESDVVLVNDIDVVRGYLLRYIEILESNLVGSPESAATSFSLFAIPIATPIAKRSARLSKTTLPVLLIMSRIV